MAVFAMRSGKSGGTDEHHGGEHHNFHGLFHFRFPFFLVFRTGLHPGCFQPYNDKENLIILLF